MLTSCTLREEAESTVVPSTETQAPTLTASAIPPSLTPVPTVAPTKTRIPLAEYFEGGEYNFVLLGSDYRTGRNEEDQLTDAFMVMNIRTDIQPVRVVLISLPRELVAWWEPDYGTVKINRIYKLHGYDGIYRLMTEKFNLEIDGIVMVNIEQFSDLIDELGGIDVTVYRRVRDNCNGKRYKYIINETYHMDADDVLCYTRMREGSANGYFDRMKRHFDVLEAIADKTLKMSSRDILNIVSHSYDLAQTDVSLPWFVANVITSIPSVLSNDYVVWTRSMEKPIIELRDRESILDPYLYYMQVPADEWMDCVLIWEDGTVCNELRYYGE